MQATLRLTDTDEDLLIPPDSLLKHLETSLATFDTLLTQLNCTPDDLHQTLADPQTNELLKLKTQLAALQLKLLAIRYIPHAFQKLIHLMNTSEKPEVARRAATTVLNIAGIATHTTPEAPTPPTPKPPQQDTTFELQEPTPETSELLASLAFLEQLKRKGLNLEDLSQEKLPALITFLTTTCGMIKTP
jgi:hypothetical protein